MKYCIRIQIHFLNKNTIFQNDSAVYKIISVQDCIRYDDQSFDCVIELRDGERYLSDAVRIISNNKHMQKLLTQTICGYIIVSDDRRFDADTRPDVVRFITNNGIGETTNDLVIFDHSAIYDNRQFDDNEIISRPHRDLVDLIDDPYDKLQVFRNWWQFLFIEKYLHLDAIH